MVESTGLENRRGSTPTVGSNPTPSAIATLTLRNPRKATLAGGVSALEVAAIGESVGERRFVAATL